MDPSNSEGFQIVRVLAALMLAVLLVALFLRMTQDVPANFVLSPELMEKMVDFHHRFGTRNAVVF